MSATVVLPAQTAQTEQVFTTRLNQLPDLKEAYEVQLDKLTAIFIKHRECEDLLSLRLKKFCASLLELDLEDAFGTEDEIKVFVGYRINELAKLLINPLNRNVLLQDPMLDGNYVWEKWMLDDYKRLWLESNGNANATIPLSPYHGTSFAEARHLFAEDMLKSLSEFSQLNLSTEIVVSNNATPSPLGTALVVPDPKTNKSRFMLYMFFAKKAMQWEDSYARKVFAEEETKRVEDLRKQCDEHIARQRELARQEAAEHLATIDATINGIQETQRQTVETLHTVVDQAREQCRTLEERQGHADAELKRQDQELRELRYSYVQMQNRANQIAQQAGKRSCVII